MSFFRSEMQRSLIELEFRNATTILTDCSLAARNKKERKVSEIPNNKKPTSYTQQETRKKEKESEIPNNKMLTLYSQQETRKKKKVSEIQITRYLPL